MKKFENPEPSKLNLVALMDIFTILVFFLMVNSSNVEVMEGDSELALPKAYSEEAASSTLKLVVVNESILVQGREILTFSQLDLNADLIPALQTELGYQADKNKASGQALAPEGRPITLFADQELPYEVLRLILATCAATDYRDVSLAVERVEELDAETALTQEEAGNV